MHLTPTTSHLYYQSSVIKPFVDKAKGVYIWDSSGKRYLDGCSGAMICNIGHGDERITDAMNTQASRVAFSYRTQFENEPAHRLAERLANLSAEHLSQVFYVSGGSEAVESAMKLCLQYHYVNGQPRSLFVSRKPSYHGATLGALSLTAYAPLEIPFQSVLNRFPKIPAPYCYRCEYGLEYPSCGLTCAWALERCIQDHGPQNIAAFVAEPVTGASIGALPPPEGYFDVIQSICKRYNVLLVLDEVMTGYGRTGTFFGYEHWDVEADVIALSKGMASGYFPLGGTVCRPELVEKVLATGGFQHGHTYAGNPLACAVGMAVLDVMEEDKLCENVQKLEPYLGAKLRWLGEKHQVVGQVRGKGFLWALELVRDQETREPFDPVLNACLALTEEAFYNGLLVYPRRCINGSRGDHILVAPPLITAKEQIDEIIDMLDAALQRANDRLLGAY